MNGISNDQDVMDYAQNKATDELLKNSLHFETKNFIHNYLINSFDWADLAQEWRNHKYSYTDSAIASGKSKHANWASKQLEAIDSLVDPARNFIKQLNKIFNTETVDLIHVSERIQAAYDYFFKPMDDLVFEVLWKIEEVKRMKKGKAFFDELTILEELQSKAVLKLMKAKLLIETVVAGETISKEKLSSEEIKKYISRKTDAIQNQFKDSHVTLIEDDVDANRYTSKKATKKPAKKSTVQETYELWVEKNSIADIATIRVLTKQTIYSHFVQLIQTKAVSINEVLPEDKIKTLAEAFQGYKEESLNTLMENNSDKFTWNEARMYKATLN
jgi:uncharacterized protein YpbB